MLGSSGSPPALLRKVTEAGQNSSEVLKRHRHIISPGRIVSTWLPQLSMTFSRCSPGVVLVLKDHRTKQTTLLKMVEEGVYLHPAHPHLLRENTRDGVSPIFRQLDSSDRITVTLIEAGVFHDCLCHAFG